MSDSTVTNRIIYGLDSHYVGTEPPAWLVNGGPNGKALPVKQLLFTFPEESKAPKGSALDALLARLRGKGPINVASEVVHGTGKTSMMEPLLKYLGKTKVNIKLPV